MIDHRPIAFLAAATVAAVVAVAIVDPWSIPAMLLGILLGAVSGVVAVLTFPSWFEPEEGPITALRRRQPRTAPLRRLR